MSRSTFLLAGATLSSPVPLGSVVTDSPAKIWVDVHPSRDQPFERPSVDVIAEKVNDEGPIYTIATVSDGTMMRFYGTADVLLSRARDRIDCWTDLDVEDDYLSVLLHGSVAAAVAALAGRTVLHASAVSFDGQVIAFAAESGGGKTTLATLCCAAGAELVTDDVLVLTAVTSPFVEPASNELRVRPSSLSAGASLGDGRLTVDERTAFVVPAVDAPLPLAALAFVDPQADRKLDLRRLRPSEAMLHVANVERIEGWQDPGHVRGQFEAASSLVESIPVYHLSVPWGPPFDSQLATQISNLLL